MANSIKPYRVLSIDGGGMRGLYTAILLDTLAARFSHQPSGESLDIGKGFDLIVGTSAGAIMAIALTLGISSREIVRLYRELGPKIFRDPVPHANQGSFPALWKWVWRNWKKPANQSNTLREGLVPVFNDISFQEVYTARNIGLCVPVTNVAVQKGVIFKTPHNPYHTRDAHYKLLDICIATISAPILFPLAAVDDPDDSGDYKIFADGGLWANNPVLIGLSEALTMSEPHQPIEIVSLGACDPPAGTFISKQDTNWGLSKWGVGTHVLALCLEAQSHAYNHLANSLCQHFKKPCHIMRPLQSSPSAEQEKFMNMDQASPSTLKVLSDLAKQDAEIAYRTAIDSNQNTLSPLKDIFKNMPTRTG